MRGDTPVDAGVAYLEEYIAKLDAVAGEFRNWAGDPIPAFGLASVSKEALAQLAWQWGQAAGPLRQLRDKLRSGIIDAQAIEFFRSEREEAECLLEHLQEMRDRRFARLPLSPQYQYRIESLRQKVRKLSPIVSSLESGAPS